MPPWNLPANKTQSGILTRSSKEGTAENANWIRFEDKRGEEQLFIHAEKNQDIEVENDETHWVGRDREKTIDRDETVLVKRDRSERVDNNETISIGNDRTEDVGHNETISIANNRKETVGGNENVSISKTFTHSVGQTEIKSVSLMRFQVVGLNETLTVGGMQQSLVGLSRIQRVGMKDSLKVGKTLSIDAGESIELVCGDSKIVMTPDAIYIDSPEANLLGSKIVNIDGRIVNLNGGVASGASTEGPDEPEEASLMPTASPEGAAVMKLFSEKAGREDVGSITAFETNVTEDLFDSIIVAPTGNMIAKAGGIFGLFKTEDGLLVNPLNRRILSPLEEQDAAMDLFLTVGTAGIGTVAKQAGNVVDSAVDVARKTVDNIIPDDVSTLFRRDSRGPEVIFDEGFKPRKPNADVSLEDYVNFNEPSQYVGTSKVDTGASAINTQTGQPGYLYEIRNPGTGIDVNKAYPRNPFSHEQEVAIPGGIDSCFIRGCTPIDGNNAPRGGFIENPNYIGGD